MGLRQRPGFRDPGRSKEAGALPVRAEAEARFLRLVETNRRRLVGIVRSYARGADAGDLFQELLLQIWKGLPGFEGRSSRNTWAYRVALNTAMTYRRNESLGPSPGVADSGSELENLRRFLAGLNGADRAIFLMYVDDLSYQEMAEVTGLDVSRVGVKIHRVKQAFIDQYATSQTMELDRFRAVWSRQPAEDDYARGERDLIEQVRQRMRAFQRKIFWRDALETAAAILVAVVFGSTASFGGALMQVGAAVVIAAAAVIVIILHSVRRRGVPQVDVDLKQRLQGELNAVKRQIKLLRNVLYWCVGPLFVGGLMFGIGLTRSVQAPAGVDPAMLLALGTISQVVILVGGGSAICRLNRVAVREQLEPLRRELAHSLESLSK